MINLWNVWHGFHKISAGCQNCYMFRRDAKYGKDSTVVAKTANFRLPIMKKKMEVIGCKQRIMCMSV